MADIVTEEELQHLGGRSRALARLVLGVTGHRDLRPEQTPQISSCLKGHLLELAGAYPSTPLRLISALAEGADRLAAQVFLDVRDDLAQQGLAQAADWDLVVVLPLQAEEYGRDFPDSLEEFRALTARASIVMELPQRPAFTQEERAEPGLARDLQYLDVGSFIVRHCHLLLAMWDGVQTDLRGGTAQIVDLKLGRLAEHHFNDLTHFGDHDFGPVVWISAGRRPPHDTGPDEVALANLDPADPSRSWKALSFDFLQVDELNRRIREIPPSAWNQNLATQWSYLAPGQDGPNGQASIRRRAAATLSLGDAELVNGFVAADYLALGMDRQRKRLVQALYILGGLTAAFLWTAIDGLGRAFMITGYAVSFASIGGVLWLLRPKDGPKEDPRAASLTLTPFLYRILAESMRVQFYWSLTRLVRSTSPERRSEPTRPDYPIRVVDSFLGQQLQELGWVREALRGLLLPPADHPLKDEDVRVALADYWIADQGRYFSKSRKRAERLVARLGLIAKLLYAAGVVFAGLYVLEMAGIRWPELVRRLLGISAAISPALALVLQGYVDKMGLEEQTRSYDRMELIFDRAGRSLEAADGHYGRRSALLKVLGTEAITETTNWLVLKKSRTPTVPV